MKMGRAIRLLRAAKGLQQADVARQAGLDASYVSLLEADRRTASSEALQRIADALGVPVSILQLLAADEHELRGIDAAQAQELGFALASAMAAEYRRRKAPDAHP